MEEFFPSEILQAQEADRITDPRTLIPAGGVGPLTSGSQFHKVSQGTPIHGLIASSTAPQNMQINAITRAGTINSDGVIITVDEEALLSVSAQTFKVLIMYLSKATEQLPRGDQITAEAIQRSRAVSLTLEEYMRACRIRDKKTAREQLNAAVLALYGISLEWDETEYNKPEGKSRKVKERVHHRMRITDHTITREEGNPVKRGAAEIRLTFDMAEYLAGAYIMPYPSALLTINTHNNPYSIPLGWKLCALYNMNYGKPRQNRTTVETLLRAAKGIPRYNVIAEKGQVYDRIIKPFDRDMRALVEAGVLSSYYYFEDNGDRVDNIAALSYSAFSTLNVWYELKGYPDQAPRLEAKQRRISAAINRAKRAARKKSEQEQTPAEDSETERERE
jgi:hypothetical protein